MEGHLVRATAIRVAGSPQKARLVADVVRGKMANDALVTLKFMPNAAAKDIAKVIKSAMSNAEENFGMNADDLIVKTITVDEAPMLKRRRFASRGRSNMIRKRNSHIAVVLVEREGTA
ncbi:MAG: 50S ribosomal protein L22 [Chloroflexota bacterium]